MAMFGGKKAAVREPPVDRVRVMMRSGMSEKDIVRQLKAEGYSFGEIEKALMEVVKRGASPLPQGAEFGIPPGPAQAPEPVRAPTPAPAPAQAETQPAPVYNQTPYEAYQPAPVYPSYPELAEEELQPEVIMEELIESVTEEKFEKFSASIKRIEDTLNRFRSEITEAREAAEKKPAPEIPKELSDQVDALEVRIGGLEKAFKQFLPQLSENIAAISRMVAERKQRSQY